VRILVSGAGIAGPCVAYWLERYGFTPTLVERAPGLRTGGYVIDFWGAGFDVADRMGIVPELMQQGYRVREVRQVDRGGKRVAGFAVNVFDRMTHGRFISVPRSALAASIYGALGDGVETIFDDSIAAIEDRAYEVRVQFERSPPRSFDLVIGADGLHSQVRQLVFGEQDRFERYLGLKVAAFRAPGYRPRDELVYVLHPELGQQVGRFTMRGNETLFLFTFADPDPTLPSDLPGQKALVRDRFSGTGWEIPAILEALERTDSLYLDRVSQIHMDRWTRNRVALVGDAAFCVSLLAGQGSALAMVAAYVLAGELKRANGDHAAAFARYQERLDAYIKGKQAAAVRFSSFFAPRTRFGIFLRTQVMKLMSIPFVADLAVGRDVSDVIELPAY
jgi:2-polyprenyl-6-methoxyphenol hydroxylase-like FAD-dependent oxidoreductase